MVFRRVSWTARRSNQSILKEIGPEYSLEGLMLKLKLKQGLCISLEGWDGEGDGRDIQKGGYICMPMVDSC